MKTKMLIAALFAAALPQMARADVPVAKGEDFQINAGVLTQALGLGQQVKDPYTNDARMYLFMKEARVRANGNYQDFGFNFEMALGGEDAVAATTGVGLSLLDLSVNVPLHLGNSFVKVGQFKVPYGRERLTYSGYSQFMSRSIADLGFRVGRDVGVTVNARPGPVTVIAGVFTGGGRDVPADRFLPERLGIPQLVARVGVGDVDDDPYELRNDLAPDKVKAAFFVNGLYTKDSTIGHSTVLNVKLIDKSILLNSNWNPYIAKSPWSQGAWWQVGADAAVRAPLALGTSYSGEAEANWGGYSNDYGGVHVASLRVQNGVMYRQVEIALRYAVLFPDAKFASGGNAITGSKPIQEVTPMAAYYINGQRLKLVADLPVLINTPVLTEKNIGSYVGTELPDQTSVLAKGGTVARQTVVEARMMLQAAF
jgi:hypothetical protein